MLAFCHLALRAGSIIRIGVDYTHCGDMKSGVPMVSSRQLAFYWRISCCLVLSLCLASLSLGEVSPKVQWKNQRLSVNVERASLSQVLQEVAQQTHIQTLGLDQLKKDKMVSAQFVALPLDDALKR